MTTLDTVGVNNHAREMLIDRDLRDGFRPTGAVGAGR
jgi:hypothetical protein